LAFNRFGEYIALSHAAMTAEGDNRVLMTKITKDLMTNIFTKKSGLPQITMCPKNQLPKLPSINDVNVLYELIKLRELYVYNKL
jgi:acyl-CoA oxidase